MKRQNIIRFIVSFVIIVVAIVTYFYFHNSANTSTSADKKEKVVNIGYLPIYVDLPLFVAKENGFFKKNGVEVNLVRFESSPNIGNALLTNKIDVGASIATSVALSIESRDPSKLKIFIVDAENPEEYLSSFIVLKSNNIDTITKLKGKNIGCFPGPTALNFSKLVLKHFGLYENDYNMIELSPSMHLSALESGTIDALFTYEPIATQAVLEKNAIKLIPGAVEKYVINPWQAGVWVISQKFILQNPSLSRKIIKSLYDAIDYMRQHPQECKVALDNYTSIKSEVALKTPNIPFTKINEADLITLQKHSDILQNVSVLSKRVDVKGMIIPSNFLPKTK